MYVNQITQDPDTKKVVTIVTRKVERTPSDEMGVTMIRICAECHEIISLRCLNELCEPASQ